jgi:quercetin dioxygenase-like cupin family protein
MNTDSEHPSVHSTTNHHIIELEVSTGETTMAGKSVLFTTRDMQVVRMVVPAHTEIPEYEAQGEMTLHCLQGRVIVKTSGLKEELSCNKLLCLSIQEPFVILGLENSLLLLTIALPKTGNNVELIG